MQIAIVYYSFSGKTRKLIENLSKFLENPDNVIKIIEIKPKKESSNFFIQVLNALLCQGVKLNDSIESDFSGYDIIFIASPVWAAKPAPCVRSYLSKLKVPAGKKFNILVTYGSGFGKERCLNTLEVLINRKKGVLVSKIAISDKKVEDTDYLREIFSERMDI